MIPWYRKVQFEIRIVYQAFPGILTVREWAFNFHRFQTDKDPSGKSCIWAATSIRILGLDIGAGFFLATPTAAEPSTSA